MFQTVADYAAWYRRRLAEILARLRGSALPPGAGGSRAWRRAGLFALRLASLLVLAGALAYGIWIASRPPPEPAFPLPWSGSPALEVALRNYVEQEGHLARGQYFSALVFALQQGVQDGSLKLSIPQVQNLLGPPNRVREGPPLTWDYRYGTWSCGYSLASVVFENGQVKRVEFAEWIEPAADLGRGTSPEQAAAPALAEFTLNSCLRDYLMREGHARRGPYFETLAQVLDEAVRSGSLILTAAQIEDLLGRPDRAEDGPPPRWLYDYAGRSGKKDLTLTVIFSDGKVREFNFAKHQEAKPDDKPGEPASGL